MKINPKDNFEKIKKYFENNAGRLSVVFFLAGFIFDNLTLTRIDSLTDNLILLTWLSLAFVFILINNIGDYKGFKKKFMYKIYSFAPFVIQFAFGALFSGYVIFYSRSSSFFDSWPFLIVLYLMFVANEKFRKYYEKFHIQMTIFYFAILAFMTFYIPILFGEMNNYIFIFSGFVSLFVIYFIIKYFLKFIPNLKKMRFKLWRNILAILVFFNLLYFNQLLPPVPLSVKEIGIYHYAGRNAEKKYELVSEKRNWYSLDNLWNVYKRNEGEKIYAYAAVFAPTGFETKIKYIWYWYDEKEDEWVQKGEYSQNIIGGRGGGFKSSALISKNIVEGDWKLVLVSNEGAVINSVKFEVENTEKEIPLVREVID